MFRHSAEKHDSSSFSAKMHVMKIEINNSKIREFEDTLRKHYPHHDALDIKVAARMIHFMDVMNNARQKGLFFYPGDFVTQFDWDNPEHALIQLKSIAPDYDFRCPALINETYFEKIKDHHGYIPITYRLRPSVSASQALLELLSRGITVLDCETTIQFARYLTLLSLLQHEYGERLGNDVFDTIFGHPTIEVPEHRRVLFCHVNPMMSLSFMNQESWRIFPFHLLSFFMNKPGDPYGTRSTGSRFDSLNARGFLPGDQLCFQNLDLYIRKHSGIANASGMNAIFCWHDASVSRDYYTFYGAETDCSRYDEVGVLDYLRRDFNKNPAKFRRFFVENYEAFSNESEKHSRLDEFDAMQTLSLPLKKILSIPGLQKECRVSFNIDNIKSLFGWDNIQENLSTFLSTMNAFYFNQTWLMKRKRLDTYFRKHRIFDVPLDKTDATSPPMRRVNQTEVYFEQQLSHVEELIKQHPKSMVVSAMPSSGFKPYSPAVITSLQKNLSDTVPNLMQPTFVSCRM